MEMLPVRSTTIVAVGYDAERRWLDLRFMKGVTYRYLGVPPEVFNELVQSASKGSFVNTNVKGGTYTQL